MKNVELLLILIVTLGAASFVQGNIFNKNKTKIIKNNLPVPSIIPSNTPSVTISLTPSIYKKNFTPTPTQASSNSKQNINDYKYPNSSMNELSGNKLSLQSSDDPNTITNWYKDKLKSLNMNANSFVTTSSNGVVLNKLVSANGETKVSITISKKNDQPSVGIAVSIN